MVDFKYIAPREVEERLTKDRATAAIQIVQFAKFEGKEPDKQWVDEAERLKDVLTDEEKQGFLADVEKSFMTQLETSIIQAKVEQRPTTEAEAKLTEANVVVDELKAEAIQIKPSPVSKTGIGG